MPAFADLIDDIHVIVDTALSNERKLEDIHVGAVICGFDLPDMPTIKGGLGFVAVIDAYDSVLGKRDVGLDTAAEIAVDLISELWRKDEQTIGDPPSSVPSRMFHVVTQEDIEALRAHTK